MIEVNKIYHGDCLEVMKDIREGSIDMVLCDLPYGTTQNKWDSVIDFEILWSEYKRVCKESAAIVLNSAQPFTAKLICSNINDFKYCWIWEKSQYVGHLNAYKMPMRAHEEICVFYLNQPKYNYQLEQKNPHDIRPEKKKNDLKIHVMGHIIKRASGSFQKIRKCQDQ